MPLACDPKSRLTVSLKSDRAKPADQRPTFEIWALSCREVDDVDRLVTEALDKNTPPADAKAKLDAILKTGLAGGRNIVFRGQPVDPATAAPGDYLTPDEVWELALCIRRQGELTEEEKTGFSSPSIMPLETSAPTATAPTGA